MYAGTVVLFKNTLAFAFLVPAHVCQRSKPGLSSGLYTTTSFWPGNYPCSTTLVLAWEQFGACPTALSEGPVLYWAIDAWVRGMLQ